MRFPACFGHSSCSKNSKKQKRTLFFSEKCWPLIPDSPDQTKVTVCSATPEDNAETPTETEAQGQLMLQYFGEDYGNCQA